MNAHETHQEGRSAAMGTGVASEHTVDAAAVVASHEHRLTFAQRSGDPLCERCLRPWRGDAEGGGCESVLLARQVVALRERAEWTNGEYQAHFGACHDALNAAIARVALLEGLLRPLLSALVVDVGGWLECDACTGTWRGDAEPDHEDGCPVPPTIAALLEGAESRGATQGFALPPQVADGGGWT